jgi:hypothetical protein
MQEFFKQLDTDNEGQTGSKLVTTSCIWANPEDYNSSAAWIKDLEACSQKLPVMAVNK